MREEGRLELSRVSEKSADPRHPQQQRPGGVERGAVSIAGYADGNDGRCLPQSKAQIAAVREFLGSDGMRWSTYEEKSWYRGGSVQKRRLLEAGCVLLTRSGVQVFWSKAACG
jgi:hypothetical protein